jgi:hypothetical protein
LIKQHRLILEEVSRGVPFPHLAAASPALGESPPQPSLEEKIPQSEVRG